MRALGVKAIVRRQAMTGRGSRRPKASRSSLSHPVAGKGRCLIAFLLGMTLFSSVAVAMDEIRETRRVVRIAGRFIDLDVNGDRMLDSQERAAIVNPEGGKVFDSLDRDRDTVVSRREFIQEMGERFFAAATVFQRIRSSFLQRFPDSGDRPVARQPIVAAFGDPAGRKLFSAFDLDSDGQLSPFETVLMEICLISILKGQDQSNGEKQLLSLERLSMDSSREGKILSLLMDADADGKVSKSEFGPVPSRSVVEELGRLNGLAGLASGGRSGTDGTIGSAPPASGAAMVPRGNSRNTGAEGASIATSVISAPSLGGSVGLSTGAIGGKARPGELENKREFLFPAPPGRSLVVQPQPKAEWRYTTEKILW